MTRAQPGTITRALNAIGNGHTDAPSVRVAFDVVYAELRKTAMGKLAKERGKRTIQTTVLIHEAYVKLFGKRNVTWDDRAHFYGAAANAMMQILVDEARKRKAAKQNRGVRPESLRDDAVAKDSGPGRSNFASRASHGYSFWIKFDRALKELEALDERMAQVVKLHCVVGWDFDQIARALKLCRRTIFRDWTYARAWLRRKLGEDFPGDE